VRSSGPDPWLRIKAERELIEGLGGVT